MGAKRVTPEEIIQMHKLYEKYGNYEEVGRLLGRSGTTVRKYIMMTGVPQNVMIAVQNMLNEK